MTKNLPLSVTAGALMLLCSLHFFSSVYVAEDGEQKPLAIAAIALNSTALPYQPEELQQHIAQWIVPEASAGPAADPMAQQLAGFDQVKLGNITLALLAIYQRQQAVAVLAIQQPDQQLEYVRLAKGQSLHNIELAEIGRSHITLRYNEQQQQLQLFNPGSAVTE